MIENLVRLAADTSGGSTSTLTLFSIVSLLFGTGGTTVALITSLANRKKNRAETVKSLVEATSEIIGPYSAALEMQKNQLIEQSKELYKARRELQDGERKRQREVTNLSNRVRELEIKLAEYERLHGPLVSS